MKNIVPTLAYAVLALREWLRIDRSDKNADANERAIEKHRGRRRWRPDVVHRAAFKTMLAKFQAIQKPVHEPARWLAGRSARLVEPCEHAGE
jgi:hypothetical protein